MGRVTYVILYSQDPENGTVDTDATLYADQQTAGMSVPNLEEMTFSLGNERHQMFSPVMLDAEGLHKLILLNKPISFALSPRLSISQCQGVKIPNPRYIQQRNTAGE
jgi:hypothetical protein